MNSWSIGKVCEALSSILVDPAPWQALTGLGVVYSWFIWLCYVLPTWTKEAGHTRMIRELRFPQQTLWKHMVLWGLVFGFLLQHYARAADLPALLVVVVIAGLVWGFHEVVWQDVRWVRQRCRESYRTCNRRGIGA
jgi:hypothetical protein